MTDLLDLYGLAEEHGTEVYWFDLGDSGIPLASAGGRSVPSPWTLADVHSGGEEVKLAQRWATVRPAPFITAMRPRDVRQKYENRANKWAYKKLVPQDELAEACLQGYREPWELAEYFGVTEFFLRNALEFYRNSSILV